MNDIIKKILTLKDDYNMIRVDDVYTDKWIGRHYGSTQPGRMGKKGYTEEEFDKIGVEINRDKTKENSKASNNDTVRQQTRQTENKHT